MKKKIVGICVCMLLIISALTLVSSIENYTEKIDHESYLFDKIFVDEDCGCGPDSNIKERSLGKIKYYKPTNPKDASTKPAIIDDLPDYFSWRDYEGKDWTTPAKNQLWPHPCGSCWAHAVTATIESIINIREGNADLNVDLSEQYLLSCLPRAGDCFGGSPYAAFYYIMSNRSSGNNCNGIIPESCFPYQAIDTFGFNGYNYDNDPVLCDEKSEDWEEYLIPISDWGKWYPDGSPEDRDAIKTQIMQSGPVTSSMVYTLWYHSEDNIDDWGYEHQDPDDYFSSSEQYDFTDHCASIVGWKDDPAITNGGYWIIENTLGPEWGYDGFFNLEYGCLNIDSMAITWVDYDQNVSINWEPVADAGENIFGNIGEELLFDGTGSFDHEGEIISYEWDFGDGNNGSGETTTHTYNSKGIYPVTLTVMDSDGNIKNDTIWAFIETSNDPPDTPIIKGPLNGKTGTAYDYTFSAMDPDGDDLYYFIVWGDAFRPAWIGPFPSGENITFNHTWIDKVTYNIKLKVKDKYDFESDWAALEVSMPKIKSFNFNFNLLNWLYENFPNAIPILKQLLRLG
jgi:C1A family cysteine protease